MYHLFRIRDGVYYVAEGLSAAKAQAAADRGLTIEEAESQPNDHTDRCFWYPDFVGERDMRLLWWEDGQGNEATFADRLNAIQGTMTGPQKFFESV